MSTPHAVATYLVDEQETIEVPIRLEWPTICRLACRALILSYTHRSSDIFNDLCTQALYEKVRQLEHERLALMTRKERRIALKPHQRAIK